MEMKFYIGQLEETNGEYEYKHTFRFKTLSADPEGVLEEHAKNWYTSGPDEDNHPYGYYYNGGSVFVQTGSVQEISEEIYNKLEILTEM